MEWQDEGYLLSKNIYSENSIIIDAFTLNHGKYNGIVYGGSSRKVKKIFQIGNKIFINWKSKSENHPGYFSVELIKPTIPLFFDDKKKSVCLLAAASILIILLPERQTNKKIFISFEKLIENFHDKNWIKSYIFWELSLIKELGFEIDFMTNNSNFKNKTIEINNKFYEIPRLFVNKDLKEYLMRDIYEALIFNNTLLMENFIIPYQLKIPYSRKILEDYFA